MILKGVNTYSMLMNSANTISFPHMFYATNKKSSVGLSYSIKSTNESLKSLLMTKPGELMGDPAYGCGLREKLFDIKSVHNIADLKNIILTAILRYLPRISTTQSQIKIYSNPNDNRYKITITYSLMPYSDLNTFSLII